METALIIASASARSSSSVTAEPTPSSQPRAGVDPLTAPCAPICSSARSPAAASLRCSVPDPGTDGVVAARRKCTSCDTVHGTVYAWPGLSVLLLRTAEALEALLSLGSADALGSGAQVFSTSSLAGILSPTGPGAAAGVAASAVASLSAAAVVSAANSLASNSSRSFSRESEDATCDLKDNVVRARFRSGGRRKVGREPRNCGRSEDDVVRMEKS